MPQTVDHEKMKKQMTFDVSAPTGSPTGIPVMQIPHMEFPRVVYKHPVEPFRTIVHRNNKFEVVAEEVIPAEHISLVVTDKDALEKAQKDGYELKPYIPQAVPDPDAHLYAKGDKRNARSA